MIYLCKHIKLLHRYIKIAPTIYGDLITLSHLKSFYIWRTIFEIRTNGLLYLPNCFVYSGLFAIMIENNNNNNNNKNDKNNYIISYKATHYLLRSQPSFFHTEYSYIDPKYKLSESFIRYEMRKNGPSLLPWTIISKYYKLSLAFIMEFKSYLQWNQVISRCTLDVDSIKIIEDNPEHLNWDLISNYFILTYEFINMFIDKLNWKILSTRCVLDKKFLFKYQKYVTWDVLMLQNKIDEKFIIENASSLDINMFIDKGLISKFRANKLTDI